jgi:hypothetical protein
MGLGGDHRLRAGAVMTAAAARRRGGDVAGDEVRVRPGELKRTSPRDWLIRFGLGAGVSALAGVVSALAGPRIGGMFLAFPAILLASLTLVAKEDGPRQAATTPGAPPWAPSVCSPSRWWPP